VINHAIKNINRNLVMINHALINENKTTLFTAETKLTSTHTLACKSATNTDNRV